MPITSAPQLRYRFDSARVENCGPSMHTYVPPRLPTTLSASQASQSSSPPRRTPDRQTPHAPRSLAEERARPQEGAVDELVRHHELRRLVLFLQRAHRRHGDDALHAQQLHREQVGAKVDLARQQPMAAPMPRQKRDPAPFQLAQHQLVRRLAKRRLHGDFLCVRKARHGIEPTAADNPDLCLLQIFLRARCAPAGTLGQLSWKRKYTVHCASSAWSELHRCSASAAPIAITAQKCAPGSRSTPAFRGSQPASHPAPAARHCGAALRSSPAPACAPEAAESSR